MNGRKMGYKLIQSTQYLTIVTSEADKLLNVTLSDSNVADFISIVDIILMFLIF